MNIAHVNASDGAARRLADAQRRLGHEATVFSLGTRVDRPPHEIPLVGAEGPLGWNAVMLANWRHFSKFDVIHVHASISKSQLFFPMFKRRYPWIALAEEHHESQTEEGRGRRYPSLPDLHFHSVPDRSNWLPNSMWLPYPVGIPELLPRTKNRIPRFVRFTSGGRPEEDRVVELFKRAFGRPDLLSHDRVTIHSARDAELWEVSRDAQINPLVMIESSDVVIEEARPMGTYGLTAIEAMSYAKPVLGTPQLGWYPGCPIVSLAANDVTEVMRELARDADMREELGIKGRAYVARVHDSMQVARVALKAYYDVLRRPALTIAEARAYWTRRGQTYVSELSTPMARVRYAAQADELLEILRGLEFESIAEIGCGFGRIGDLVTARRHASWTGVDLSRAQLLEASRTSVRLRGRVAEGSAENLPLRSDAFDLVLTAEMLMHIPPDQIRVVLQELWRVARRYIVHLDWYEDYLPGFQTGWCWVHDYPALWGSLGATAKEFRLHSTGIQSVFVLSKPGNELPATLRHESESLSDPVISP